MSESATTSSVVLVTPGFYPSTGGVEAHVSALATELVRLGISVQVLTARRDVRRTTVTELQGAQVVTYPAWRLASMSISPRLVWGALRRRRADTVMHVHSYHASTAISVFGRRSPTVFTPHYHGQHGHSAVANLLHIGYARLAKLLVRRCDAIVCVSHAERDQLAGDFPVIAERISVIPNGVAVERIQNAQPYRGQPPTVIAVGRLEPYKKFDTIISAFATVRRPAQLVIVGDGTSRRSLENLVTALGIGDRVRLLGAVDDDELHRWLRTAAVSVSMSEREAFGIAPLEAAGAGARIVLSDIPAHREIAERYLGDAAVVVSDPSPDTLARAIDRQLAVDTSTAPRIPDWPGIAAQTAQLYAAVSGRFEPPGTVMADDLQEGITK